jgi:hypothetical protein
MLALRSIVSAAILAAVLAVILTACSARAAQRQADLDAAQPTPTPSPPGLPTVQTVVDLPPLPDQGAAPDFANKTWINADVPLTLGRLRGKVVLVEFWTFG